MNPAQGAGCGERGDDLEPSGSEHGPDAISSGKERARLQGGNLNHASIGGRANEAFLDVVFETFRSGPARGGLAFHPGEIAFESPEARLALVLLLALLALAALQLEPDRIRL